MTEGRQARNPGRNLNQKTQRNVPYWLTDGLAQGALLNDLGPPYWLADLPRDDATYSGLGCLRSINNQDNLTYIHWLQTNLIEIILQLRFLSDSKLYQIDNKTNQDTHPEIVKCIFLGSLTPHI